MQINVYVQIQNRIIIMEKLHTISCEAVKFQIIKFNSNVIRLDGQLVDVGTSFIKLSSHMVVIHIHAVDFDWFYLIKLIAVFRETNCLLHSIFVSYTRYWIWKIAKYFKVIVIITLWM